jgi:aminoglycoside phosphotransferase (APT) family kinase protein
MSDAALLACLPEALRASATIAPIRAGLSGAGVYRVEAGGAAYALKVSNVRDDRGDPGAWPRRLAIQRAAGDAGVAPRVVHADAERRAVISELVADRGFGARANDPRSRAAAIAQLGALVRRIHALPVAADAPAADPVALLRFVDGRLATMALPDRVRAQIARALAAPPPASGLPRVLSHNDLNPSNLVDDGERFLVIDWDAAAVNDPIHDLATLALFLRMTDAEAAALLAAYAGDRIDALAAALPGYRRFVALLVGTMFGFLAHTAGHPGDASAAPGDLAAAYQRMRAGTLAVGSPDGQWTFALALLAEAG